LDGMRHDNIVKLLDVIPVPSQGSVLVLPHHGPSAKLWKPSNVKELMEFFRQLFAALTCCHRNGVMHNDVKPSNVLFHNGRLVLIDFGLSIMTVMTNAFSTGLGGGTLHYSAPETLVKDLEHPLTEQVDCWSAAVFLGELMMGEKLWDEASPDDLRLKQAAFVSSLSRPSFLRRMRDSSLLNDVLWAVFAGCLCVDSSQRMTASDALRFLGNEAKQSMAEDDEEPDSAPQPVDIASPADTALAVEPVDTAPRVDLVSEKEDRPEDMSDTDLGGPWVIVEKPEPRLCTIF